MSYGSSLTGFVSKNDCTERSPKRWLPSRCHSSLTELPAQIPFSQWLRGHFNCKQCYLVK